MERFHSRGQHLYANLLGQKIAFAQGRSSTPTELVWDTNMATVTSCENTLLIQESRYGLSAKKSGGCREVAVSGDTIILIK